MVLKKVKEITWDDLGSCGIISTKNKSVIVGGHESDDLELRITQIKNEIETNESDLKGFKKTI